jgi:hypothetical protein
MGTDTRDGELLLFMVTVTVYTRSKKVPVIFILYFGTGLFRSGTSQSDDPKRKRLSFYIDLLHKTSQQVCSNFQIMHIFLEKPSKK